MECAPLNRFAKAVVLIALFAVQHFGPTQASTHQRMPAGFKQPQHPLNEARTTANGASNSLQDRRQRVGQDEGAEGEGHQPFSSAQPHKSSQLAPTVAPEDVQHMASPRTSRVRASFTYPNDDTLVRVDCINGTCANSTFYNYYDILYSHGGCVSAGWCLTSPGGRYGLCLDTSECRKCCMSAAMAFLCCDRGCACPCLCVVSQPWPPSRAACT